MAYDDVFFGKVANPAAPAVPPPIVNTPVPDIPDFTDLLVKMKGGTFEAQAEKPVTLQSLGLGLQSPQEMAALSLPSLTTRSPKVEDWRTEFQPAPKYTPLSIEKEYIGAGPDPGAGGGYGGNRSGNWGPSAYGYTGRTGVKGTKGSSPYGFQGAMWAALQAAQNAMAREGLGKFGITDGWRSYEAQVAVKKAKGNLAATPGRSVHGLGLAADLRLTSAQQKWLEKNGAKFGLARLPSESWHWQYLPSLWKGK